MKKQRFVMIVLAAVAVLIATFLGHHFLPSPWRFVYEGEGVFVDRGITATSNRYWLRIDSIDVTRRSENRYAIGALPQAARNLGLRFTLRPGDTLATVSSLTVRVALADAASGSVLYEYEGRLYDPHRYDGEFSPVMYPSHQGPQTLVMYTPAYEPCERLKILWLRTPLCRPAPRTLSFAVIAPVQSPMPATMAELVIFGGGWK